MLYSFIYYLGVTTSLTALGSSALYYFNRPVFNNLAAKIGWTGLNIIAFMQTTFDDFFDISDNPLSVEIEKVEENKRVVSYSLSTGVTTTSSMIPPSFDMLFIKKKIDDKTYCKRLHADSNLGAITFIPAHKPFIQIELKYDEHSLEIHDYLDYFYIVDNHILDTIFLKWYMKYWYHINIPESYSLHIIDSDVNIVELSPQQSILIEKEGYQIVTREDSDEDSDEEKCEEKAIVPIDEENSKDK